MTRTSISRRSLLAGGLAGGALLGAGLGRGREAEGERELRFEVTDGRGQRLPCRIHVTDGAGKPVRAAGQPFWRDHFVCDGRASVRAPPGRYRYEIERGPEWGRAAGTADVTADRDETVTARLLRVADLPAQGWFAGDLHVHRPLEDVPLLMRAEDLHVAPVITWWNRTNLWN